MSSTTILKNQRGQGLIEYLVIVALMGVATIGIVRVMSEVVSKRFATAAYALQGDSKSEKAKIDDSVSKKKDLGNFFNGASKRGQSTASSDDQ